MRKRVASLGAATDGVRQAWRSQGHSLFRGTEPPDGPRRVRRIGGRLDQARADSFGGSFCTRRSTRRKAGRTVVNALDRPVFGELRVYSFQPFPTHAG